MQTHFSLTQLADAAMRESESILRKCVHCGFCLATCPTYTLLGDERDSPRGRIYLMKDMFEQGRAAGEEEARHLDRCLSCLSCMTTCPSGVNYMHLVDHGRAHVAQTYRRPWRERLLRGVLQTVLPHPALFRLGLIGALLARPFAALLPAFMRPLLKLAPSSIPSPSRVDRPQTFAAEGQRRRRVALLSGCAQTVLDPAINEATVRLLTRHGCEVVVAERAGCCGALTHHMGEEAAALDFVKANVAAWSAVGELDAIVVNTSGCGTMVKDYGFLLRDDATWRDPAAAVSAQARDISELMDDLGLNAATAPGLTVAYHSACSLQHGQRVTEAPKRLLAAAGFVVRDVPDGHLCCGSAGTYNLLQPEIATALRDKKVASIESLRPDLVAAGNIGCMTQIASGTGIPVVHTAELLDWATGGPKPAKLN